MRQFESVEYINNKDHFPFLSQKVIELYLSEQLDNVKEVLVEPLYGYVTKIEYSNGTSRITNGNDIGINTASSSVLAKDKGHTKALLNSIGVKTPKGQEFMLPWWEDKIRQNVDYDTPGQSIGDSYSYIEENIKYPVYIKPINGSLGAGIFKIHNSVELGETIEDYENSKVKLALIEEAIDYPDYRLVVMDNELVYSCLRIPFSIKGDGESTIGNLIYDSFEEFKRQGRKIKINEDDPIIIKKLEASRLTKDFILPENKILRLLDISNLSRGGACLEISNNINSRWINIASYIGENFGLKLLGLDIAIEDISDQQSDYKVFEVNSSPGMEHYASIGDKQLKKVTDFIISVINHIPE